VTTGDAAADSLVDVLGDLERDRPLLERSSTAERVAEILRGHIMEGRFRPGDRLSEEGIKDALRVSRNTLREAFRLLAHERLVVVEFNRGAFVRRLTVDEVVDLYLARRLVECAAVRQAGRAAGAGLAAVRGAVEDGEAAASEGRWVDVGTANVRFHRAVVALAGSARLDEFMRQVSAELRLAFDAMTDVQAFHEPFLRLNRVLLERLEAGDAPAAEALLTEYLADAERRLVATFGGPGDR
jgi:DNA-binding GntR family transcriptional regulator